MHSAHAGFTSAGMSNGITVRSCPPGAAAALRTMGVWRCPRRYRRAPAERRSRRGLPPDPGWVEVAVFVDGPLLAAGLITGAAMEVTHRTLLLFLAAPALGAAYGFLLTAALKLIR